VYCESININEEILDQGFAEIYNDFCDISEFSNTDWAREHGCSSSGSSNALDNSKESEKGSNEINNNQIGNHNRDDRDLNCKDFNKKNIPIENDDPHNLDTDGDGIGCKG